MQTDIPLHERKVKFKSYRTEGRLQDVLALITVLGAGKWLYKNEEGILSAIRRSPRSAENWTDLALQHPEFFTPDRRESVALLLRTVRPLISVDGNETREPLNNQDTQSLMTVAATLHEKAGTRHSRSISIWIPLAVTIITAIGVLLNTYYVNRLNNAGLQPIKDSIQALKMSIINKK